MANKEQLKDYGAEIKLIFKGQKKDSLHAAFVTVVGLSLIHSARRTTSSKIKLYLVS